MRVGGAGIQPPAGAQLAARGINEHTSVLAAFFPDDVDVDFGVVVTPERRVYEFDLRYGAGDLTTQVATATITDWRDRTDWWQSTPSRRSIEDALVLLGRL
ncbi:MAG: hypothetical protein M3256_26220 [Actinomycetota bacterium]|nr:hypothetical protein [Actinomycetota bacterium]